MSDNDQQKELTRNDLIDLIIRRERMWLDASVAIANMLPEAWDEIESFLAEENMVNLLLTALKFDPTTEVLEYNITEENSSVIVTLPIPLSLAIAPKNGLDVYLRGLPIEKGAFDELTDAEDYSPEEAVAAGYLDPETMLNQRIRLSLARTQRDHPNMYMDIDRLTDLEIETKKGTLIKYPPTTTMQ